MKKLLVFCAITTMVISIEAGYQRKRYATTGTYAGGGTYPSAGAGGFAGGFDAFNYNYAPDFGFIDPFLFHQQLTSQILADHAATNNRIQQQIAQQQSYFDAVNRQNQYGNRGYKHNRYAPSYAAAGASIAPEGYHQTAYISPENPAIPNISNRFGSASPGGYKGVSVSSFSTSSDINGHRSSQRGAQTTINDNGKITTYRVHS